MMTDRDSNNGFTRIPNYVLEALARIRISGVARQVLDVIFRKTFGWHKSADWIPLSQFVQLTGIQKKPHVSLALKKLLELNLITKKDNGRGVTYSINKNCASWRPLPKKVTLPKKVMTVTKKDNYEYPIKGTSKENTKETTSIDTVRAFVEIYHTLCFSLSKWMKLTPARVELLRKRLGENPDLEYWRDLFERIEKSDFLTARIGNGNWRATLDWILKPENLQKIKEGNYDNSKKKDSRIQIGQVSGPGGRFDL